MSPPIRPLHLGHHEALWTGLSSGMLDSIGTDHCPFTMEQKRAGKDNFTLIPNGAAGIEDRLQLLYTYGVCEGHFDLQRMVALGSTNPARIFGLYPRKGTVGAYPRSSRPAPSRRRAPGSARGRIRPPSRGWPRPRTARATEAARGGGVSSRRTAAARRFRSRTGIRTGRRPTPMTSAGAA